MVATSVAFALGALLLYGGWAVASGLATRSLSPVNAVLLSYVASLVVVGGYVAATRRPVAGTTADVGFALVSGLLLAAATICFYAALARGNVAVVSAIAALYFVVPAVVGVLFLDVRLTATNAVGLALAAVAVVLVAS